MKVAETNTTATAAQHFRTSEERQQPFFQREEAGGAFDNGQASFFSPNGSVGLQLGPFFGKATVQTKLHIGSSPRSVQRLCDDCDEGLEPRSDDTSMTAQPQIQRQDAATVSRDGRGDSQSVGSSPERIGPFSFWKSSQNVVQRSLVVAPPNPTFGAKRSQSIPQLAVRGVVGSGGPLPYLSPIQAAFGRHDISQVESHVGGIAGKTASQIGARGYATGSHVAFAAQPDVHTAAHEAAHVIQQRSGVHLSGGVGQSGDVYERHADAVADRVVRRESAEDLLDDLPNQTPGADESFRSSDVVQRDDKNVSVMEMPDFADMLGLPKETIPPGVETNPEFIEALVSMQPGSSVSELEEMEGISEDVVASLPEKKVSDVSSDELLGLVGPGEGKGSGSMGPAQAVPGGATKAAMTSLAYRGYSAAGSNAIGIVAFPQSRVSRLIGTGFKQMGPPPWLPESKILWGHTAVYVRVDNTVKLIRSYAPQSLIEAGLQGTGSSVPARIIDHLGELAPPGGKMFDITSGRSIEYAVPKDVAIKFMDQLPKGGPLPGQFYSAQPILASQLGPETRVCVSRNCVHWAVDQVEQALGTKVGPGGTSLIDQPGPGKARQRATVDYLGKPGNDNVKLGTGETVAAARGQMPTSLKVLRWGNRVFTVYAIYNGASRVYDAPLEEKIPAFGEELGLLLGGPLGAEASCFALGITTGGIGLLICGIGGAMGGSWVGGKVGGLVGGFVNAVIFAPITGMQGTVMLLKGFMDGAELLGHILGLPFQTMVAGLIGNRERLNVDNWDLRYFPVAMAVDVRLIGTAVWRELGSLNANDLLGRIMNPLSSYSIPTNATERIANTLTRLEQQSGAGGNARTAAEILAMTPIDFIRMMEVWKLSFVQEPDYVGGFFPGRWEDERSLVVYLGPLIRERAEINPYNWDVSEVPVVDIEDSEESIDLVDAISSVGGIVWNDLGNLDEERLRVEIGKPLKGHNVPEDVMDDVADGGSEVATSKSTSGVEYSLEPETLLGLSPAQFVQHLREMGIPINFIKEPSIIADLALQWVRKGFKPW